MHNYSYKKVIADPTWRRTGKSNWMRMYDGEFLADVNPKDNILEIGSGEGKFLYWLNSRKVKKFLGIEKDKEMFLSSLKKVKAKNVINKDVFAYFKVFKPTNKFDKIFIIDVLEHFSDKKVLELLRGCQKALKKGGFLIIRTPNAESPLFGSYFRYIDMTHKISFTKESVRQYLILSGFSNNKITVRATRHRKGLLFSAMAGVRRCFEFILLIPLFLYQGSRALDTIFTPNITVYAKK